MKINPKRIGFYITVILIILLVVVIFFDGSKEKRMTYSEVVDYFKNEQVSYFEINDDVLKFTVTEKKENDQTIENKYEFELYSPSWFMNDVEEYVNSAMEKGIMEKYDLTPPKPTPFWLSILPYVIFGIAIILFWLYMMTAMSGGGKSAMSFGKARLKMQDSKKSKVTFKDVAGADEEKEELTEIVDFLKNPKKYTDLGARIPRGLLLVGQPGTGKTYLAKAAAGEAGVPFFTISGSDFVELYVGVGASRVRDVFEQAKKNAPCIVFIDEIDAVGRQRGAGLGGGNDEREQTLNQLLVEMDGFEEHEDVIVMAATNRPDVLDSALLRPGRFDRQIVINLPDVAARRAILEVHTQSKPLGSDVNLDVIAQTTSGFSPAELENILNEAALLTARRNHKKITMNDIEDAMMKVVVGVEKRTKKISDKEKKLTAYHEAGHAIVTDNLETQDPVHQISIIPRGMAGGYTFSLPKEDKSYMSKNEMIEEIITLMGGRASEALCLDDISTGASNDIERATQIANKMVTRYGMSDNLGPMAFGNSRDEVFIGRDFGTTKSYSEQTATEIDNEIKTIIDNAYSKAKEILSQNMDKLDLVADYLIKREKLSGEEFRSIIDTGKLPDEIDKNEEVTDDQQVDMSEKEPTTESTITDTEDKAE